MAKTWLFRLGVIAVFGMLSCSPAVIEGVAQEAYDSIKNTLSETESELEALRVRLSELEQLAESSQEPVSEAPTSGESDNTDNAISQELETLKAQYEDLSVQFDELQEQNNANLAELADIAQQFAELQVLYDAAVAEPGPINTDDVEQAIFDLINKMRMDNGLEVLLPGEFLQDIVEVNSLAMAEAKEIIYSQEPGWQEIFRAAGYDTADEIANGALLTWKSNIITYNTNILNINALYGAVSAIKSGDIIYITYLSHTFR